MNRKKLLAASLAATMAFSMAACGNSATPATGTESTETAATVGTQTQAVEETKEPVTLEWYYGGVGVQRDTEVVEDAFNELLHTYEGMEHVTVNLNISGSSDHANSVALAQGAGQQIDIIQTYKLDFASEVNNGTFIALNDLLEEYPDLKNEFDDWIWDLGSVDGNIYIVPSYQRAANLMYFIAPKEYVDEYGNAEEFRQVIGDPNSTVEDYAALLEEWIKNVQAGEGTNKYLWPIGNYYAMTNDTYRGFMDPFDILTGSFIFTEKEDLVGNIYTSEDAKKAYEISADWYEKGYVLPDIVSITDFSSYEKKSMMNETSFIYYLANGIGDEQMMSEKYTAQYGFEVYAFPFGDAAHVTNVLGAGGNGIYAKSEHPEEAMRLLELLNTEEGEALYNMLCYGIEGTHYTKVDDTHIVTLDYDSEEGSSSASFAGKKWLVGNTRYAWVNQGGSDEIKKLGEELNTSEDTQISKLVGFIADTSNIETQLAQVATVVKEYSNTLKYGAMGSDWEKTYNDFVDALEIAGYSEIVTELQSQVDAFLGK
ncbi:MAG: DUF3502 domain-containing protein [Lachnospiraceae bacterium]|nr:DUF3502 domain-containing protein [Lachnospiraceae bacterium]